MTRSKLLFVLLFCAFFGNAFAQDCPRIYRSGDTLKTDPAGGYQWYLNGNLIPNATKQWHLGTVKGDYSVEVSGTSPLFKIVFGKNQLSGCVFDRKYEPISGAKITFQRKTAVSDVQGKFNISDINTDIQTAILTVTKENYWKKIQRISFNGDSLIYVNLMLDTLKLTNRFDAQKGTTLSNRGLFITLPQNSTVLESGDSYQGEIQVNLKRFFPSEEGFALQMQGGDFKAKDTNGEEKLLFSYGSMSIELFGENNEKLQLAPNVEATLEFYIPLELLAEAPDTIGLWYFDETDAIWKSEGVALKEGVRYVGKVKHFSDWTIGKVAPWSLVKGSTVNCNDDPNPFRMIKISQFVTTTQANGRFKEFAPVGKPFNVHTDLDIIAVQALQNGEVKELGNIKANSILGAIGILDQNDSLTVSGMGVEYFTVDGGNTFYPKNKKIKIDRSDPFKTPHSGVAYDTADCSKSFKIFILPKPEDCQIIPNLKDVKEYANIQEALESGQVVYRLSVPLLSFSNLSAVTDWFTCLQSLNIKAFAENDFYLKDSLWANIQNLSNLRYINDWTCIYSGPSGDSIYKNINQLYRLEEFSTGEVFIPETFCELVNLKKLNIGGNRMIPACIGNLRSLEWLDISNCFSFDTLPASFGQLTKLEYLNAQYFKNLKRLPDNFGDLRNLKRADFEECNALSELPENIGQLNNLRYLNLLKTNLFGKKLPDSFANLASLDTLILEDSGIFGLPSNFGDLNSLTHLVLDGCFLDSLPTSFGNLKKLKYLSAFRMNGSEDYTFIPDNFGQLDSLRYLYLDEVHIPTLPESFTDLSSLEICYLSTCSLDSLPSDFGKLKKLKKLNLENNNLQKLPESISELKNTLTYLNMGSNPISLEERAKIRAWLPFTQITW